METILFEELQSKHVAAWNEKDAIIRYDLLKAIYADNIKMYDRQLTLDGLKAVSDFIGKLIAEDPAYKFSVVQPIDSIKNSARLYGQIETTGGVLNSMDFFVIENGKVAHLYAFLDPA